jgi:threonine-phosphate decarboxylase
LLSVLQRAAKAAPTTSLDFYHGVPALAGTKSRQIRGCTPPIRNGHGGNIWQVAEEYGKDINKLVDFSASINPLGIPVNVKNALIKNMDLLTHYPPPDCRALVKGLSAYLRVPEENILMGNGSIELIYAIPPIFSPANVVIPVPTFSEYEKSVKTHGAPITFFTCREKDNFRIDVNELLKSLPAHGGMVFLCNPNNPTGGIISRDELIFLAKKCRRHHAVLVIDETFINFVADESAVTMIHHVDLPVIVIRSFTKFFAIPGLRLGYLVANKGIVEHIRKFHPPWSVNLLAQIAGLEMLKDTAYIRTTKEYVRAETEKLTARFRAMHDVIKVYPAAANFILCKFRAKYDYREIYDNLIIKYNLVVRNCHNFRQLNDSYFRVAVRTGSENSRLIAALSELLRAAPLRVEPGDFRSRG